MVNRDNLRNASEAEFPVNTEGMEYTVHLLVGVQTADYAKGKFCIDYYVMEQERRVTEDYENVRPIETSIEDLFDRVFDDIAEEIIADTQKQTHSYNRSDLQQKLQRFSRRFN